MPPPRRAPVELADLLSDADDQPADDGARDGRETAEDQHRNAGAMIWAQRRRPACAPHDAGDEGDDAGGEPDDDPDLVEEMPTDSGLVAVGDGLGAAADPRLREEAARAAIMTEAIAAAAMSMCCRRTGPPKSSTSVEPVGR